MIVEKYLVNISFDNGRFIYSMEEKEFIVTQSGKRLDVYLAEILVDKSRSNIKKMIDEESIFVNNKIEKSGYKIKEKDCIKVIIKDPVLLSVEAEDIDIEVVYSDNDVIVVNKPKGMVVHPAVGNYNGTMVNAIMSLFKDNLSDINGVIRPGIVHRIDKDTSGLLVVAKNNKSHEFLSRNLKEFKVDRIYHAVVDGVMKNDEGRIELPMGRHPVHRKKMAVTDKNSRFAATNYKVLERFKNNTYLELKLETGRTHQIRVHLAYLGFPIVGDEVYGRKSNRFGIKGQVLHAKTLGFVQPTTLEYISFSSNLPDYFEELLVKLRNEMNRF